MGNAECGQAPSKKVVRLGGAPPPDGGDGGDGGGERRCCCLRPVLEKTVKVGPAAPPGAEFHGAGGHSGGGRSGHGAEEEDATKEIHFAADDPATCGEDGADHAFPSPPSFDKRSCSFDKWEFSLEDDPPVEPTLMLARFKALPTHACRKEERRHSDFFENLTDLEVYALQATGIIAAVDLIEGACCKVQFPSDRDVLTAGRWHEDKPEQRRREDELGRSPLKPLLNQSPWHAPPKNQQNVPALDLQPSVVAAASGGTGGPPPGAGIGPLSPATSGCCTEEEVSLGLPR
mmetsp:Transcript_94565/g.267157  ORF Transcript_94565/g.267157 Transcript_94565/m.267157 type:complete len:289 (-) Transcript_94565:60-926(-)